MFLYVNSCITGNRGLDAEMFINQHSSYDFNDLDKLNSSSPGYTKYRLNDGIINRSQIPNGGNVMSRIKGFFTAPYTGIFSVNHVKLGDGHFISTNSTNSFPKVGCSKF